MRRAPNAFVNCHAHNAHGDSGPLESWASGVLYDNVRIDGQDLVLGNRWTQPPGVCWSAANSVLWQCRAATVRAFDPPTASNWVFGYWATPVGDESFSGQSDIIRPLSLYQQQLVDRIGESAGDRVHLLLDPVASTSPTLAEAAEFVANSNSPAKTLRDLIEERMNTAVTAREDAPRLADLVPTSESTVAENLNKREIEIVNGWITIDGRVLTGGSINPTWWRGTIRPKDAPAFGPSISRYAPGRYGVGID